jgi:hypothetical protein
MTTQELMLESAYRSRGRIIQLAIEMETYVDWYISKYFSDDEDKQTDFKILLLGSIDLKNKMPILKYILGLNIENKKEDINKLINNIGIANTERNVFAHLPIDLSETAQAEYIKSPILDYIRMRPGHDKISNTYELGLKRPFDENKINELIAFIHSIITVLKSITDTANPVKF